MHCVFLTDEELVLLDGKCNPDTQAKVGIAKSRLAAIEASQFQGLSENLAKIAAEYVHKATLWGAIQLTHSYSEHSCNGCGTEPGWTYFKSGRRVGQKRERRKDTRYGYYDGGGVIYHNDILCKICETQVTPRIIQNLLDKPVEIPSTLHPEKQTPKYKAVHSWKCGACGWVGSEMDFALVYHPAGGKYRPSICPSCKADSDIWGKTRGPYLTRRVLVEVRWEGQYPFPVQTVRSLVEYK